VAAYILLLVSAAKVLQKRYQVAERGGSRVGLNRPASSPSPKGQCLPPTLLPLRGLAAEQCPIGLTAADVVEPGLAAINGCGNNEVFSASAARNMVGMSSRDRPCRVGRKEPGSRFDAGAGETPGAFPVMP